MKWTLSIIYPILITQLSLPASWARLLAVQMGWTRYVSKGLGVGNPVVEERGRWRRRTHKGCVNSRNVVLGLASSGEAQSLAKDRLKEGDVELAGAVARWDHTARGDVAGSGLELGSVKTKTLDGGGVVGGEKNRARGPLEMDRKRGYRVVSYRIVAGQRGRRGSVRMRTQMGTRSRQAVMQTPDGCCELDVSISFLSCRPSKFRTVSRSPRRRD